MLTETWANDLTNLDVKGFTYYHVNRTEKKANSKRHSGGVIIYVRTELTSPDTFVKKDEDDIIWLKLRGHVFNLKHD